MCSFALNSFLCLRAARPGGAAVVTRFVVQPNPKLISPQGMFQVFFSHATLLLFHVTFLSLYLCRGRDEQISITLKPMCVVPGPNLSQISVGDAQHV